MDGVLTDSEPSFHAAVNDVIVRFGKQITLDEYQPFIGMATAQMWGRVIELKQLPATVDEMVAAYEAPLMRRLREPRGPLPQARELLAELRGRGVPVGLCSASFRRWADAILSGAGLEGMFDAVSTADMVPRTKPDPAPYALAAELLGVAAAECVVVEDSASGVQSALAAGCCVIQLRATATSAPPQPGVARVIATLREFPLELVVSTRS
jgi:HAD superfamily hydrolase (TIGR01509 family)